jgi:imidazolonepropionase-like amidohydrolase
MSLDEALAAATINSAHSIGRSKTHGSIEKGKIADLVVVDSPRFKNNVRTLLVFSKKAVSPYSHIHQRSPLFPFDFFST